MTDNEREVRSAAIGLRQAHREVSVRNVAAVVKAIRGGRGIAWSTISEILKANNRFEPGWMAPATLPQPASNGSGNGSKHAPQQPQQPPSNPHASDITGRENPERQKAATVPTETSSPPEPPRRRARAPKPLPELPEDLRDDVERLVAHDASTRADGKIADSVVDESLTMLRRQFEKKGIDAVRYGIDVAIGKRKGVKYAAGVARRADPAEYAQVQTSPAAPSLFGGRVANLDDRRGAAVDSRYLPGETRREYNLRKNMPPPPDHLASEPADPALRDREPVAL
ncbi:MAG: hypothetical protein JWO85_2165 [Candidatus Eremiobacteraeota bacterium]|nr:hypothetical protein [Candidatus Eremiobacteraeota bacterium]